MELGDNSAITRILKLQILTLVIIASGFFLMGTTQQAGASALGGLTAFLPNLYFAWRIISITGRDAKKIVRTFYAGESGKLLLTAVLFGLILQLPDIEILPLMIGFMATLSVFWFALILRS